MEDQRSAAGGRKGFEKPLGDQHGCGRTLLVLPTTLFPPQEVDWSFTGTEM